MLQDATSEYTSSNDNSHALSFDNTYEEPSNNYSDAGIVFEASDTGAGAAEDIPISKRAIKRKNRRTSEATVATISSTMSYTGGGNVLDSVEDNEDAEGSDEEVEEIPRSNDPTLDESSSMMSNRYVHPSSI